MQSPLTGASTLFRIPSYRSLWAIGAGVNVARWIEFLALAIFAYQLTHSPQFVSLIGVVRMLPYMLLGFLVGAMADFLNRRILLAFTMAAAAIAALLMAVLTWTGHAGQSFVLFAATVSGFVWTTDMPVRRGLMAEAVAPEQLSSALGFDNATNHATRALGPLVGGVVYQFFGISGMFCMTLLIHSISTLIALGLEPGAHRFNKAKGERPSLLSMLSLPRELLTNRRFQVVLGVTVVYNLWCFPFVSMVPVIAQKDFALAPAMVGALSACDGVGGTLGAILVGATTTSRNRMRFYYFGTLAFLGCILLLSLHLTPGLAVPMLLLIGIAAAAFSATQFAIVYSLAGPEIRGRVTGFLSFFIGVSTFGNFHTGFLFERFTSPQAMQIMTAEGLLVMALLAIAWMTDRQRANDEE